MLSPKDLCKFYIDGAFVDPISTEIYTIRNPKDNSIVSETVPIAGVEDVDRAVLSAQEAFNGPWSTFTSSQRSDCIYKLVNLLDDRLVDILTLDSLTTGNPVSLIPTREKNYIKNCLLYYGKPCLKCFF